MPSTSPPVNKLTSIRTQLLESASFNLKVDHIYLNLHFMPLKSDLITWQETFCCMTFYAGLSDAEASAIMQEGQVMCMVDSCNAAGNWVIMYTCLHFVAVLE